jgi:hypothetical protein
MNEQRMAGQPGQLRALIETIKREGGDDQIVKQCVADLNAQQRQDARNHFESRQEYIRQVAELGLIARRGIVEYGLQTLKWLFLLNAGAIVVVAAYIGSGLGRSGSTSISSFAPLLKALWPFAVACVMVALAGAAGFFNFSYAEASLPSPETLYNFSTGTRKEWPIARLQRPTETAIDFHNRYSWKAGATRNAAIVLTFGSAIFFLYGMYRVLHAALP